MLRLLLLLVALALLATPAAALAQNAPPGNSAIDEYLETVPNATGNAPARPGGSNTVLTPSQRAELERLGTDGKVLADAVDATSTAGPKGLAGGAERAGGSEPLTAQGRSPLGEVLDAATGDDGGGGMGAVLPAILLAALLGAIALAVARRRRSAS